MPSTDQQFYDRESIKAADVYAAQMFSRIKEHFEVTVKHISIDIDHVDSILELGSGSCAMAAVTPIDKTTSDTNTNLSQFMILAPFWSVFHLLHDMLTIVFYNSIIAYIS